LDRSTLAIQDRNSARQQNVRPHAAIRPVMMSNCGQLVPGIFSPAKLDATSSPEMIRRIEPDQQPLPGHGR